MGQRPTDPLFQQFELLMGGYGYNYYDRKEQARSDDLLVRQKAAHFLGGAAQALSELAIAYQKVRIGPATREHPFPSPEAMAELQAILAMRDAVSKLQTRVLQQPATGEDRIWDRYYNEEGLLHRLLEIDARLVTTSRQLQELADAGDAERWGDSPRKDAQGFIHVLEQTLQERQALRTVPTA